MILAMFSVFFEKEAKKIKMFVMPGLFIKLTN